MKVLLKHLSLDRIGLLEPRILQKNRKTIKLRGNDAALILLYGQCRAPHLVCRKRDLLLGQSLGDENVSSDFAREKDRDTHQGRQKSTENGRSSLIFIGSLLGQLRKSYDRD